MIVIPGGWPVPTKPPSSLKSKIPVTPPKETILPWKYCECGCKCHVAKVFEHTFSIHNTLDSSETPYQLYHGHGTGASARRICPPTVSLQSAEEWIVLYLQHLDADFYRRHKEIAEEQIKLASLLFNT